MPAFRILDLAPSYRNLQGDATAAGGSLFFYDTGTLTPKAAYTANDLTGAMYFITLDSAGRTNGDVWGDGTYRVILKDALGATIWTRDEVELPGGASQVVPVPDEGEFISGDGINFSLVDLSGKLLPDPTGQSNKILGTDGTSWFPVAKPTNGTPGTDGVSDIITTSTSLKAGNILLLTGSATGSSVGGRTQSVSVVYPAPFDVTPMFVGIMVTSTSLASGQNMPSWSFPAESASGFTVKFTMGELDDSQAQFNFNAGVAFRYFAMGVKT